MHIPFNKPHLTGDELKYIADVIDTGNLSGNGKYHKLCQNFFKEKYGFRNCLLTSSGTDALEMAAILLDIKDGDEVVMPSFTFVSTANAFALRGAKIVFADSAENHPNIDAEKIKQLVTPKTKAIVVVHYAGFSCNMESIMNLAESKNLFVVEDAALAMDSFYVNTEGKKIPLGGIGHLAAFSFHETKSITSGEGGMLVVNDERFEKRAEIIWEKGTNRSAFFRGEIDKYGWVDIGSSFLPSEITAAFLYAQLENLEIIQNRRKAIWQRYYDGFEQLEKTGNIERPFIPNYATNNGHIFYITVKDVQTRTQLIEHLKSKEIMAVFHYISLHKSTFYTHKHDGRPLPNADRFSDTLLRLPLYFELTDEDVNTVIQAVYEFFEQ